MPYCNRTKTVNFQGFRSIWLKGLIWLWILVILFADLKVTVHPYIHWVMFALLVFFILPFLFKMRFSIRFNFVIFNACLFLTSILLVGFISINPIYEIEQVIKLTIILIGGWMLFSSSQFPLTTVLNAFKSAVYINVILLFCGAIISPVFAHEMAIGRWGTVLNYPGSLWRLGIAVFILSAYGYFISGFRNFHYGVLLLSSLLLIFFDGSRTGILIFIIGVLFLGLVLLLEKRIKLKKTVVLTVGTLLVIPIIVFPLNLLGIEGAGRFVSNINTIKNTQYSFERIDPARFKMLKTVINEIGEHPFVGKGIGSTRTNTPVGPMVVHMTYLQVWADMGILGFVSYIGVAWGWIIWLPKIVRQIRGLSYCSERAVCYNAIYLLIVFGISGLFHPLSTEWSEWILFLFPYSILIRLLNNRTDCKGVDTCV